MNLDCYLRLFSAVIGVTIAMVALLVLGAGAAMFLWRRKQINKRSKGNAYTGLALETFQHNNANNNTYYYNKADVSEQHDPHMDYDSDDDVEAANDTSKLIASRY